MVDELYISSKGDWANLCQKKNLSRSVKCQVTEMWANPRVTNGMELSLNVSSALAVPPCRFPLAVWCKAVWVPSVAWSSLFFNSSEPTAVLAESSLIIPVFKSFHLYVDWQGVWTPVLTQMEVRSGWSVGWTALLGLVPIAVCMVCRNWAFSQPVRWLQIVWSYIRKCKWIHFISVLSLDVVIGWVFLVLIKNLFFRVFFFLLNDFPSSFSQGTELPRSRLKETLIKLSDKMKSTKTAFWVSYQRESPYIRSFKISFCFVTKGSLTKQSMLTVSVRVCLPGYQNLNT